MITIFQNLLNGSQSKSMNVDGTKGGAASTFSFSPGNGNTHALTGLICVLRHEGTTKLSNFGALAALTNGVLVQISQSGSITTIATIKDNSDLCKCFHFNQFGNGAVLSLLGITTPEGFGNSNNIFVGYMELINPFRPILLSDTDTISVTIQDNITAVNNFEISAKLETD